MGSVIGLTAVMVIAYALYVVVLGAQAADWVDIKWGYGVFGGIILSAWLLWQKTKQWLWMLAVIGGAICVMLLGADQQWEWSEALRQWVES